MNRLLMPALAVLVLSCSSQRYEVAGGERGAPLTRVDTTTGETSIAVRHGREVVWVPVAEQTQRAAQDARPADCSGLDPQNPYRDLLGC